MIAILKNKKSRLDEWQYMKFLKCNENQLISEYVINRKEAKD